MVKDRKEVMDDFKQIHLASNKEAAQGCHSTFLEKWQKLCRKLCDDLSQQNQLFTFFDFPRSIRSSIYSTNLIECFNKHLKRGTKCKEQFPNEEALERFLVTQFKNMKKVVIEALRLAGILWNQCLSDNR